MLTRMLLVLSVGLVAAFPANANEGKEVAAIGNCWCAACHKFNDGRPSLFYVAGLSAMEPQIFPNPEACKKKMPAICAEYCQVEVSGTYQTVRFLETSPFRGTQITAASAWTCWSVDGTQPAISSFRIPLPTEPPPEVLVPQPEPPSDRVAVRAPGRTVLSKEQGPPAEPRWTQRIPPKEVGNPPAAEKLPPRPRFHPAQGAGGPRVEFRGIKGTPAVLGTVGTAALLWTAIRFQPQWRAAMAAVEFAVTTVGVAWIRLEQSPLFRSKVPGAAGVTFACTASDTDERAIVCRPVNARGTGFVIHTASDPT